jgi:hypothetical protein
VNEMTGIVPYSCSHVLASLSPLPLPLPPPPHACIMGAPLYPPPPPPPATCLFLETRVHSECLTLEDAIS